MGEGRAARRRASRCSRFRIGLACDRRIGRLLDGLLRQRRPLLLLSSPRARRRPDCRRPRGAESTRDILPERLRVGTRNRTIDDPRASSLAGSSRACQPGSCRGVSGDPLTLCPAELGTFLASRTSSRLTLHLVARRRLSSLAETSIALQPSPG